MTDTGKRNAVAKAAKAVRPKPAAKTPKTTTPRAAAKPGAAAAIADEPNVVVAADAVEPEAAAPEVVEAPQRAEGVDGVEAPDAPEPVTVDELMLDSVIPDVSVSVAGVGGSEPVEEASAAAEVSAEPPVSAELKAIVEALIYASPEPLTPKALFKILDSEPSDEVERAIEALKADYREIRGLHLVEIAGGLQIVTRPDLNEWVRRLFHERKNTRLSVQSLETLAVIAYRQPVTAAEITEIRGVNTSGVLATLVERKLIKTAGRKAVVGRPFLYATTREFLLRFGLNDVNDLPKVEDLADALGFDLPGLLNEGYPTELMLPLGEPEGGGQMAETTEPTVETSETLVETTADAEGDWTAPATVPWVEVVEPPAVDGDESLAETSQTADVVDLDEPIELDEPADLDAADGGQVTDEPIELDEPADLDAADGGQVTDEPIELDESADLDAADGGQVTDEPEPDSEN
jgi:segregation and condensation protein B